MTYGKFNILVHISKLEARLWGMQLVDFKLGNFGDSTRSHLRFEPFRVYELVFWFWELIEQRVHSTHFYELKFI